jgi:hypothetical protein
MRDISELKNLLYKKEEYIKELTARLENQTKTSTKNKAGRKSKATDENVAEITRLRNEGYSYAGIAKIITESSGEYICKSTVANIIKSKKCP